MSQRLGVPFLRGPSPRVLAALAVLALLQPALTSFAPELAGWRPDHAHLALEGAVHAHHHPYDGPAAPPAEGAASTEDAPGVVFLSPDEGATTSIAPAPAAALPASIEPVPAPREALPLLLSQDATHPEPPPPRP